MKFLYFNKRVLVPYFYSDYIVKKFFLKEDIKYIYFTNIYNFKVANNFYRIKDNLSPYEKIYYLFENLQTKDYLDYPVYLFFYGDALIDKNYISKLIIKNEDEHCLKIIEKKINKLLMSTLLYKAQKTLVITFDNYHVVPLNSPKIELIYKSQVENIYRLKGKFIWINLSKADEFRYIDFSRLKFYGKIWDPFMNWKVNFLKKYDFEII